MVKVIGDVAIGVGVFILVLAISLVPSYGLAQEPDPGGGGEGDLSTCAPTGCDEGCNALNPADECPNNNEKCKSSVQTCRACKCKDIDPGTLIDCQCKGV